MTYVAATFHNDLTTTVTYIAAHTHSSHRVTGADHNIGIAMSTV